MRNNLISSHAQLFNERPDADIDGLLIVVNPSVDAYDLTYNAISKTPQARWSIGQSPAYR